jgi:hypothetical protein
MTTFNRIHRSLALAAVGFVTAGAGHAQQTWDMDLCAGGTKAASGYTGCRTASGNTTNGTLNITAYSSSGAASNFTTAQTSIHNGGSYIGVWSGTENNGTTASTAQPHHAIDNVTAFGSAYELVHLQFSKAVDLGTLVANWTHTDGDFQVFRWNFNATTTNPNITGFNPNSMPTTVGAASSGWQLVHNGDFSANVSQTITDGTSPYFSSHWLVSTAFGHNNDGFKLGTITAMSVCQTSQTATGGCAPTTVSAPGTLALAGLGLLGAAFLRRRSA